MPDRRTQALRKLLRLHLVHASTLELLDGTSSADIDTFSDIKHPWDQTHLPPDQRFAMAVESAKRNFFNDWRFRSVRPADSVYLCRVVRLRDLKYAMNGTNQKGSRQMATLLRKFVALDSKLGLDATDPAATPDFSAIQNVLLELRSEIVGARLVEYETLASGVHGPGSCWVSFNTQTARAALQKAQYWRDRLGLHHLPLGGTLGDQLVRLKFRASLSALPCPVSFNEYETRYAANSNEIWLARPSTGDMPNPRFVQARLSDTRAAAAPSGATVDLSTDGYDEAEDELVLLHGRDAHLKWIDMELLDGLPARRHRDGDHETFFKLIESRHVSLSK